MANWNKVTAKQFGAIKTLLRGGATKAEAAVYLDVSPGTVSRIEKAETFEEYQQMIAEKTLAKSRVAAVKAKEAEKETAAKEEEKPREVIKEVHTNVTIQATHYMMEELRTANKLLGQISAKLAYIVEDLYGAGKKEG